MLIGFSNQVASHSTQFLGGTLDGTGYIGWKQIFSKNDIHNTIPSEPEVGLLLTYKSGSLELFAQGRYGDNFNQALVFAFASYSIPVSEDAEIKISAGRVRNDLGLYGNDRVNPRTRPGVIEPQAIYWNVLGTTLTSGDGFSIDGRLGEFTLSMIVTQPMINDDSSTERIIAGPLLNRINVEFGSYISTKIIYDSRDIPLTIKASWSKLDLGNDKTQIGKMILTNYTASSEFLNAGFKYSYDDFSFSSEVFAYLIPGREWIRDIGQLNYGTSTTVTYDVNSDITARINFNQYSASIANSRFSNSSWFNDVKDLNFGITYHTIDWQIGAEFHQVYGARWVSPKDDMSSRETLEGFRNWWIVGLNAVYFFN